MVAVRIDPQLAARVDPSDVVQEAMAEASRKLPAYLRDRPVAFYPWLRQIAWERLVHLHDRHVKSQKRSVNRERSDCWALSDNSAGHLVDRLVASDSSPAEHLLREELRERVRAALDRMAPHDREVLVMWHLEELSIDEIAEVLGLTQAGVKSRHRRALERLVLVLDNGMEEMTGD
jgi:RNA polymerase sigma-70 factor (ECF subfamily)